MTVAIASLNTAVERHLTVDGHRPGSVHRLAADRTLAGGKGVNVARVLTQLAAAGAPPARPHLFGFLGGPTGRLVAELLGGEGLEGTWRPSAGGTRICEVLVDLADPEGATVYNASGPRIAAAELADLEETVAPLIADAGALVCTGSLPPGVPDDFYGRLITAARRSGTLSVLDAHGRVLRAGAAAGPDIVKVNRDELLGAGGGSEHGPVPGWLGAGVRCVIVTDGARPTRALTPDGWYEVTAPAVPTRSAVGSGDAFCAGLVHSLVTGDPGTPWRDHLRFAAACGASNAASLTAGLAPDQPPAALIARAGITGTPPGTDGPAAFLAPPRP
ncbi:PfkB family carbohydrate kinase [Streptomyces sp. RFCAC02]|uniref:1-phosphofructokinase family hexose kinase n=1 Tax=Streptomyces sp. RFCAC02 TaxID=2499143 RepID=UPI001020BBB7|nr:PfkB family carbohydrate kinase [Streptomyces sp. RFCAC02]